MARAMWGWCCWSSVEDREGLQVFLVDAGEPLQGQADSRAGLG